LAKLDKGDVKWQIDFRSVYADVLQNWMGTDAETILKRKFNPLNVV